MRLLPLFAILWIWTISPVQALEPVPHFLDNGEIKLGVDKGSGASLFFFAESKTGRNLLNHADRGRFVQQSYYGQRDSSDWNGKPWRWNPVQGGNWKGKPSKLLEFKAGKTTLYAKSIPHHWASENLIREARMEEWIELHGPVAKIRFRFTYDGETAHPPTHQELPAVFMDHALPNLVFYHGAKPWTGGQLSRVVPGWPNETQTAHENWAAYVDGKNWGCGLCFPGSTLLTTYRHPGPPGPKGGGCSYFAPLRTMAVTKGLEFEYTVFLTIGTVDQIRKRFQPLATKPAAPSPQPPAPSPPAPVTP